MLKGKETGRGDRFTGSLSRFVSPFVTVAAKQEKIDAATADGTAKVQHKSYKAQAVGTLGCVHLQAKEKELLEKTRQLC